MLNTRKTRKKKVVHLKILKYFMPVLGPQTPNNIKETIITPVMWYRIRLDPQTIKMRPTNSPNKPTIDPTAIKNSTPSKTLSK